jgi:hypothetical protein
MCLIFYPFLILFCSFTFLFFTIFNFYTIKKIAFQKLLATHHKWARDSPVWETLLYSILCSNTTPSQHPVPCTTAS